MSNPKDLIGSKKAPLGLVPPALEIGAAEAMANGAEKYGPYNWRETPVEYMTYLAAIKRHVDALIDGEDVAPDSGIHHLKHIVAGGGILLDSLGLGTLIDNRPPKGPAAKLLEEQDKSNKAKLSDMILRTPPLPLKLPIREDLWPPCTCYAPFGLTHELTCPRFHYVPEGM